ncbi:MAG: hypothetical protein E6G92_01725 [Alphaproteobacteria bacterium]|nr:MAG: hypothetical protein E6G92_01725 [Alphaproteobacteria bacterium]
MSDGLARLSERERQVLRLLSQGHDAKSAARSLDVSVHAVNERLREARRKLGVTSSREAARLFAAAGHDLPKYSVAKKMEVGSEDACGVDGVGPDREAASGSRSFSPWSLGAFMILLFVAAIGGWTMIDGEGATSHSLPASPRVTATSPAQGAAIAPGPFELSVTFDRPMQAGSYSFVQVAPESYPDCGSSRPAQSRDGRTFTLRCAAVSGRSYEVWLNSPPYMNFKSVEGVPAGPYQLRFRAGRR